MKCNRERKENREMKFKEPIPTSIVVKHLRACGLTSEEISEFIQALSKLRTLVGDTGLIKDFSISINGGSDYDVDGHKDHPGCDYAKSTYVSRGRETTVYYRFRYS